MTKGREAPCLLASSWKKKIRQSVLLIQRALFMPGDHSTHIPIGSLVGSWKGNAVGEGFGKASRSGTCSSIFFPPNPINPTSLPTECDMSSKFSVNENSSVCLSFPLAEGKQDNSKDQLASSVKEKKTMQRCHILALELDLPEFKAYTGELILKVIFRPVQNKGIMVSSLLWSYYIHQDSL